jgi:hypothetical protein
MKEEYAIFEMRYCERSVTYMSGSNPAYKKAQKIAASDVLDRDR